MAKTAYADAVTSTDSQTWTTAELERELDRFEQELRAAELAEASVRTYVDRSRTFIRWLAGEYTPQGPAE